MHVGRLDVSPSAHTLGDVTDLVPPASSDAVRARMQRQRRTDTGPEIALRAELWRRGLRYRVDHRPLAWWRRRADLVFVRAKVAVFVDGCFWHSCPAHRRTPTRNGDWWRAKLQRTELRDRDTDAHLSEHGWAVVRVWEHEAVESAADRVSSAVRARLPQGRLPAR